MSQVNFVRNRGRPPVLRAQRDAHLLPQLRAKMKEIAQRVVRRAGETKWVNTLTSSGSAIAGAGTDPASLLITNIGQGATVSQRDGNVCNLKRLQMRLSINNAGTATVGRVRCVVFWDRQPVIGAPVTYSALFTGQVGNEFCANRTIANQARFHVIYDKTYRWQLPGNNAVLSNSQVDTQIRKSWKGTGTKLHYTSATATDIQRSHLYVLFVGDLTANQPTLRLETQLTFTDSV